MTPQYPQARTWPAMLAVALLHAAAIAALTMLNPVQTQAVRNVLMVQLNGLLTGRQVESQPADHPRPVAAATAPQRPPVQRKAFAAAAPEQPRAAQTPADEQAALARPVVAAPAPAPEAAAQPAPSAARDAPDAAPQTIARRNDDRAAMRAYLASLQRALQRHLRYPAEAQLAAEIGDPVVRFSLAADGALVPGSLSLVRSSGSARLDDSALEAVRNSAPMDPPPRPMQVVIAISFERQRSVS